MRGILQKCNVRDIKGLDIDGREVFTSSENVSPFSCNSVSYLNIPKLKYFFEIIISCCNEVSNWISVGFCTSSPKLSDVEKFRKITEKKKTCRGKYSALKTPTSIGWKASVDFAAWT